MIDAATLKQIPIITKDYEVLACYGTNGFTSEHNAAIRELNQLEEVVIFFDGDKREVQYMAGHKYVSSTERYQLNNLDNLQSKIEKLHPLSEN